jgi:hypothetical protein
MLGYQESMVRTATRGASRAPLVGGLLAGPLFTALWIVGGRVTPGYDPMRHLVSSSFMRASGTPASARVLIFTSRMACSTP